MERTVDLNLGCFSLSNVEPRGDRRGSIILEQGSWYIGKSKETESILQRNLIVVCLLHQQRIPFSKDLCIDISNICNSRQMVPYIITATDLSDWCRSGLETVIVPSIETGELPPDIEQLLAPDVITEISEFIAVFGRGVCVYSRVEP